MTRRGSSARVYSSLYSHKSRYVRGCIPQEFPCRWAVADRSIRHRKFEQMMFAAVALQIRGMCQTALTPGDRMVNIAVNRRHITAGCAAGQIPAPHELGERG
jgi:hypothetical protein